MQVQSPYRVRIQDQEVLLPAAAAEELKKLDIDGNRVIDDLELAPEVLGDSVVLASNEAADLLQEYKCYVAAVPNPYVSGYHSFAQVEQELEQVAEAHRDIVRKVSLGKSAEGRDIWALKISGEAKQDTSHKPGVVLTGCHHAREWMTVEAPLKLIHDLTDSAAAADTQKRLTQAEIWVVPVVNPDGYEFSRTENNYWRKNRSRLGQDQAGKATAEIGVDLNRNYWDGKPEHHFIYRPEGDTPGNLSDDFSATSDDPAEDTYRGPYGGSEPEVKALLDLELGHSNIKAVIDYHSYGDMILYPYGHTHQESPNAALYQSIGQKMQAASSGFTLEQSVGLYPASGTSDDTHDLNGVLSFTIEMGRSFQPNPVSIPVISDRVRRASEALIDQVITLDRTGQLPAHASFT